MQLKLTVFTHREEAAEFKELINSLSDSREISLECNYYDNYDDFIRGFPRDESQAVIVARRGADGMECARNARLMCPHIPLIWFSNDKAFGIESYRLGCAFFSAEPITEKTLKTALLRCII